MNQAFDDEYYQEKDAEMPPEVSSEDELEMPEEIRTSQEQPK